VLNHVVHASPHPGNIDAFVVIAAATALTVIYVTRRAAPPDRFAHAAVRSRTEHRNEGPDIEWAAGDLVVAMSG